MGLGRHRNRDMDKAKSAGTNQQPERHYSTAGESHDLLQKSDLPPLARTASVRICVEVIPMQIGTQIYIALQNGCEVEPLRDNYLRHHFEMILRDPNVTKL